MNYKSMVPLQVNTVDTLGNTEAGRSVTPQVIAIVLILVVLLVIFRLLVKAVMRWSKESH